MPIEIDRAAARDLAPRLHEALELVRNEFEGLDTHRQYRNAFARLLKPDPLGRVSMMGTDQRDMFVPELRRVIEQCVPSGGHILDFGAGDGQTFALVADSVPGRTRVSIEEPNPGYLADYIAFVETQKQLRLGTALEAGFDEMDSVAARLGQTLPQNASIDLCLALHMIYYVNDLATSLVRMMHFLKRGGALFVGVTDEAANYTGRVLNEFIEGGGSTGDNARHLSGIDERRRLLGTSKEGGGAAAIGKSDAPLADGFTAVPWKTTGRVCTVWRSSSSWLYSISPCTVASGWWRIPPKSTPRSPGKGMSRTPRMPTKAGRTL